MYFRTRAFLYRCLTCQQHFKGSGRICSLCLSQLPWLAFSCYRCALPLKTQDHSLCRLCRDQNQYCLAKRSLFCFSYAHPIDQMIKAWKFDGALIYEAFFIDCLTDLIQKKVPLDKMPEGIISVPISKKRCQERGFNQSMALTKKIAKTFQIKRYDDILGCHFQKHHQASLSSQERKKNLITTFYLKKNHALPKHMAIVDDVMTTGATLNTIAQMLFKQGVEKVEYWGIARVD
jgi:ComF family protein